MFKAGELQGSVEAEGPDWRALFWALLLVLGLMLSLIAASLALRGEEGHYLVIAPPWSNQMESLVLLRGTEGQLVSTGGLENILIVASEEDDFVERVKAAGAWAVWPAPKLIGCGDVISRRQI